VPGHGKADMIDTVATAAIVIAPSTVAAKLPGNVLRAAARGSVRPMGVEIHWV